MSFLLLLTVQIYSPSIYSTRHAGSRKFSPRVCHHQVADLEVRRAAPDHSLLLAQRTVAAAGAHQPDLGAVSAIHHRVDWADPFLAAAPASDVGRDRHAVQRNLLRSRANSRTGRRR